MLHNSATSSNPIFIFRLLVVGRRNYKPIANFRPVTMNDLPKPEGNFFELQQKRNQKYNTILAAGIILFGTTLYIVRKWFWKVRKLSQQNYIPGERDKSHQLQLVTARHLRISFNIQNWCCLPQSNISRRTSHLPHAETNTIHRKAFFSVCD